MNMRSFALGVTAAIFGVVSVAGANELVVTPAVSKSGHVSLAFDIASSGDVAGFNFKISMPGLVEKKGEVPTCVADLPRGFSGACSVKSGGVYVFATSDSPSVALPAGVTSVGKITVAYSNLAKASSRSIPVVEELAFFDNRANPLPVRVQMDKEAFNSTNIGRVGK